MIVRSAMRANRLSIGALVMLTLYGCGFSHEEKIDGPYYLIAVDASAEMEVSYKVNDNGSYVGRIPPTVFSIGWDDNYVVAKRHPAGSKSQIQYYYLDRALDGKYKDASVSVRGPLSEREFYRIRKEIGLPEFSKTLNRLE